MDVAKLIAPRQRKIRKRMIGTSGLEPLFTFDNETDKNIVHIPAIPNRIIPRAKRIGCFTIGMPFIANNIKNR
jgi:hypothetical protein